MFVVGKGWLHADGVEIGHAIRRADLTELRVLAVEIDPTPQIVHNLEVAGAHTYFAGELEAWGHNVSKKVRSAVGGFLMHLGATCGIVNTDVNPSQGPRVQPGGGTPSLGGSIDPSLPPKTPNPKFGSADDDKKRRRRGCK